MVSRVEVKAPVGSIRDVNPALLPEGVWSSTLNVEFDQRSCVKTSGYTEIFATTPSNILYMQPSLSGGQLIWYEANLTDIYTTEGSVHTNVSSTAGIYDATEDDGWSGVDLNGVAVLNNKHDNPQSFNASSGKFEDLPNWPAATQTDFIGTYKNFLIALGVYKTGAHFENMVKWSSQADPGGVPFTWDETDPTNSAGEVNLQGGGSIKCGAKLKDSYIIYKDSSVTTMNYVGGDFIFSFRQLFDDIGIINKGCVQEFNGNHFVVGRGDVYVHNGVQKKSVINGKMRNFLFTSIRSDAVDRTHVIADYNNTSMWICFCSTRTNVGDSNKGCDLALIWDWTTDLWALREIPYTRFGTFGVVDPKVSDAWDDDTEVWSTDTQVWGEGSYNPSRTTVVFSSTQLDKVYSAGGTSLFDTTPFTSSMEKTDVSLGDDRSIKEIISITPHTSGCGEMEVYVGSAYVQNGPINWKGPFIHTIGSNYKVDFRLTGRYLAVRFVAPSLCDWTLTGYTYEVADTGGIR